MWTLEFGYLVKYEMVQLGVVMEWVFWVRVAVIAKEKKTLVWFVVLVKDREEVEAHEYLVDYFLEAVVFLCTFASEGNYDQERNRV